MYLTQTKHGKTNWSHPPCWFTASLANLVNCTTKRPPFLVQNTLQILSGAIFQRRISHVQMHLEPLLVQGWWMAKSEFSDVPHPPKSLSKSPMPAHTKHYPCSSQHRFCLFIYRFLTKWFSSSFIPNFVSHPWPNMRRATFAPCELPTILVSFRMDVRDLPANEMPCTKTQFEETTYSSHTHWEWIITSQNKHSTGDDGGGWWWWWWWWWCHQFGLFLRVSKLHVAIGMIRCTQECED